MATSFPLPGGLLKGKVRKLFSPLGHTCSTEGATHCHSQRSTTTQSPPVFHGAQLKLPSQGSQIQDGRMHGLGLEAAWHVGKEHRGSILTLDEYQTQDLP